MTKLERLRSWERELETNEHGMVEFAEAIVWKLARELSQRTSTNGLIDWSGVKVISWGKIPK